MRYFWVFKMSYRLEQMRRNPQGNLAINDIEKLCAEFDVICAPPRGGGSHYRVAHPKMIEKLTIPYKRPIKPIYIKKLVGFIDQLQSMS